MRKFVRRDFLRVLARSRAERDRSLARIFGDVFRPDFTRPGAWIPFLVPVVRLVRAGERLCDLVPTPDELEATEAILVETRALLDSGRNHG